MTTVTLPAPPAVTTSSPQHYQLSQLSAGWETRTEGIRVVHAGTPIESTEWKLRSDLVAHVRFDGATVVATNHEVEEYGAGSTVEEAVKDLLASLANYIEALLAQEYRLDSTLQGHLRALNLLLEAQ